MGARQIIQVSVPESLELDRVELEALRSALQAIVDLRLEAAGSWRDVLRHLTAEGWTVEYGLQWHVVARGRRELEEACGRTRDEAFAKLDQVTRASTTEGTP